MKAIRYMFMYIVVAFFLSLGAAFVLTCDTHADAKPDIITDCDKHRADDTMCMACNIYHESQGEPNLGKLGVGLVTINRTESEKFPDTICEVVWEKHRHYKTKKITPQFSWTLDGKSDLVFHEDSWNRSMQIANRLVNGAGYADITSGALWYHADYVDPPWSKQLYLTIRIGPHLYYAADEESAYQIMEANFNKVEE